MADTPFLPGPKIRTSNPAIDRACRIALGDLMGNVHLFQDGLLDEPQSVLLAGLDYDTPWTRDAAINVWNGLGLIWPDVARSTLHAVLERQGETLFVGGQYWDAIIWAVGAWEYYLHTGDRFFLALAFDAVRNSLERFEREEFDTRWGLFRGPAVYGDGVSAYPDRYSPGGTSSILDWVEANPGKKVPIGFGIPMMALSTNCLYTRAYRLASLMSLELEGASMPAFAARADALAASIRRHFWDPDRGTFNYLTDSEGVCDSQEGLGHSFAILFDVADEEQARSVLLKQHITPAGIPCVWPAFPRYAALGGFGRHSGTVWPFISAFWSEAALLHGRSDLFERELLARTSFINRDGQCAEIYHPRTGAIHGGLQEAGRGPTGMEWVSCARQSWTASAYLRMLLAGIAGLRFSSEGISFSPHLPPGVDWIRVSGLRYRSCRLHLTVEGRGGQIVKCRRNGKQAQPFVPVDSEDDQYLHLQVGM